MLSIAQPLATPILAKLPVLENSHTSPVTSPRLAGPGGEAGLARRRGPMHANLVAWASRPRLAIGIARGEVVRGDHVRCLDELSAARIGLGRFPDSEVMPLVKAIVATQMGMGLDPGAIQAVSAASGVWREDGCLQGFFRSKLTRDQVQHDSGLIHVISVRVVKVDTVAKYHLLQTAMKGKKRKVAGRSKQPKPKQPRPKPKGKADNLGWVGPVSPQGKALKERLEERANSRIQFVKCYVKGFIRWAPPAAIQRHVAVTLTTWDAVWGEYMHPKWAEQKMRLHGAHEKVLERYFKKLEEEAASVSQQQWGARKQLVVFFGNAGIGTRGGWGAKAVLQACRKVVERPNSGKPTDRVPGKVVTLDEFRTSSIMNSPQPYEEELDSSKPTRPEDWKPKPGQVQNRLLRSAWSKRFEAPVRGLMWCPWLAQAIPGDLGKWMDRDCNAALNLQRAEESKWRPLELCRWPHRGRLPAKGKEYSALGFKKLPDPAPKALAQQPVAQ
ncbi:hypothetical protein QJQ45_008514 [Haematococcus lacustris]|nr:hypothetical protein QJQ45_008514 [Haematococcus lacustris]